MTGPDPTDAGPAEPGVEATELARLVHEIPGLRARAIAAHQAWVSADASWRAAVSTREALAAQLQAWSRVAAQARPTPDAPGPASSGLRSRATEERATREGGAAEGPGARASGARAGDNETSTRTVQNVLFVLGGLLLGTAAVAFTAVAWTTFGVGGRAAILAVVTLVALGIPLLALARGLRATAETFAAIGLLLVVLDGYAAWYVDLGHVQSMPGTRYAGLVALTTSVVALSYRRLTGLVGPAFAALLAVQPVLLLTAERARPQVVAVSLLVSGTAALNALVAYRTRRGRDAATAAHRLPAPAATVMIAVAWVLFGVWLAVAVPVALLAEILADSVMSSVTAGLATIAVAGLTVAAARFTKRPPALRITAGLVVVAVAIAADFVATEAWPGHVLVLCAAVALAVGTATFVSRRPVSRRLVAEAYRPGVRVGALIVAVATGVVTALLALISAGVAVTEAFPLWTATLGATGPHPPLLTWELPVSALVLAVALLLITPQIQNTPQWSRVTVGVVGVVVAVLALPAAVGLAWWAPAMISLGAAAALVAAALTNRAASSAASVGSAVLLGFAVLTGAARPGLTALVLTGTAVLGLLAAAAALRRRSGAGVGPVALVLGLVAIAPAIGSALVAWRVEPWWAARGTVLAVCLLPVAILAVRRWSAAVTDHRTESEASGPAPAAMIGCAFAAALLSAVLWPAVAAGVAAQSLAVYCGVSLLLIAAGMVAMPAPASDEQTGGGGPGLVLVGGLVAAILPAAAMTAAVLPAVATVAAYPYTWLTSIWTGRPPGVGLVPTETLETTARAVDAIALGLLAVACGVAVYAVTRRPRAAIGGLGVGGPTAILVALVVAGAAWPSVPAATLLIGLLLVGSAALVSVGSWRTVIAAVQGIVYIGAGITGSLAEEWATLAALGSVVVAGAVIGVVGRTVPWRVAGLVAAVGFAAALAATAGFAADLHARDAAFAVLGVAVVALFVGAARLGSDGERRAESSATQAVAHAAAAVALLFTTRWLERSAGVSAAWGLAVGVRALLPHTSRSGRATLAAVAAGLELLAWWLLLVNRGVTLIEAYTLPLAAAALLAGWAALRSRPDLRSWVAYGPALAAAFLPSLAAVLSTTGDPWRRLALGAGALAVVVVGSIGRRQAPVVIGGVVLVLVALHELVLLWQRLPGWVPLAVGGVVLVGLAITYERRLRDVGRLRSALGRMT